MKYKVGDKVRIKSKEWYEENKNEVGDVRLSDGFVFWESMKILLNREFTIKNVLNDSYRVYKTKFYISDEMIEGLVSDEKPIISTELIKGIANVIKTHNLGVSISENEGRLIIEPLKVEEEKDLPVDTPCMVANIDNSIIGVWRLAYYAGKKLCYDCGNSSKNLRGFRTSWNIIIPFDKFNPNDIEESLKYNIVK